MAACRSVSVHLAPLLVAPDRLAGGVAVVIDVLRATTTMVYALAAGCPTILPCGTIDEARAAADVLPAGKALLAGERDGVPLDGFDLGNSPREFTPARCKGQTLVLTTSNGTRALLHAAPAERVLVAAFANFSAVCEQLKGERRPMHIICAGDRGGVALEDVLLAGALVDYLAGCVDVELDDGARLAWDGFEHHGRHLGEVLALTTGGVRLRSLGYDEDIRTAARIDVYHLVPELRRDPHRVEIAAVGITGPRWRMG
ncbi:MAG: 2-phosphosulfolactate phosphatase [Gemmataceae bacterium]